MPTIYCFINQPDHGWLASMAMAEDGTLLAEHISSNEYWAKVDIGFAPGESGRGQGPGREKRVRFARHYPNGYDLEWVDDPRNHEGLQAAYKRNQEMAARAENEAWG